jgi:hypothetical protein
MLNAPLNLSATPLLEQQQSGAAPRPRARRPISLRETLTLSPYQKWRQHRVLPTKLLVHICVALLSATLQIMEASDTEMLMHATRTDLQVVLYPTECIASWRGVPRYTSAVPTCRVRVVKEVIELLHHTVRMAANTTDLVVGTLQPRSPDDPVRLTAWFTNGRSHNYSLTPEQPLGPFANHSTWREWLNRVDRMELAVDLKDDGHLKSFYFPALSEDTFWRVTVALQPVASRTSMHLGLRCDARAGMPPHTPRTPPLTHRDSHVRAVTATVPRPRQCLSSRAMAQPPRFTARPAPRWLRTLCSLCSTSSPSPSRCARPSSPSTASCT